VYSTLRKKFALSYFFIFIVLLLSMSISKGAAEKMRGSTASFFAPFWEKMLIAKYKIFHPLTPAPSLTVLSLEEERQKLELENQLLNNELASLYDYFSQQAKVKNQMEGTEIDSTDFLKKLKIKALPARVIFRSLDTWNQNLWINIGESENGDENIISLNSPVVAGSAVIGVVDYVGKNQSRVRLITDPGLTPSVRALRGGEQDAVLGEQIEMLVDLLKRKRIKNAPAESLEQLDLLLTNLKARLHPLKKTWHLGKGELQGLSRPSGRGKEYALKGTGFNYDFPDEKGGPYDLRSGKTLPEQSMALPLVKVNDILVTTGMDGVFPPGLKVAKIDKIEPLKEGDYFYELEASPLASHLQGLSLVFVLPPLGFDSKEKLKKK
jgi:cell shape-determining protein MreC